MLTSLATAHLLCQADFQVDHSLATTLSSFQNIFLFLDHFMTIADPYFDQDSMESGRKEPSGSDQTSVSSTALSHQLRFSPIPVPAEESGPTPTLGKETGGRCSVGPGPTSGSVVGEVIVDRRADKATRRLWLYSHQVITL